MEGIVKKLHLLMAPLAGIVLAIVGVACWVVAGLVYETNDGFYVTVGSRTFELGSGGLLGDFGTYVAEWGMLSLFCMAGGALLVVAPRIRDQFLRGVAFTVLVLSLVAAVMFAYLVLS